MLLTTFEIYMTSFLEAMIECHLHSFVCFNFLTASCIKWDLRSRPGIEPLILVLDHWKCRVLTTELPGKFPHHTFKTAGIDYIHRHEICFFTGLVTDLY